MVSGASWAATTQLEVRPVYDKFMRHAYEELARLRLLLDGAQRHRLNSADDLRRRIAISEWRIRALENAAFNVRLDND